MHICTGKYGFRRNFCVRDKTDPGICTKEINVVGITYALTDLLIKFCDPGQKRFVGKVCDIHNADKYIGEKAGGKDSKGSSCQLFVDNIQDLISKGISVLVINIMKIFHICGNQGDSTGASCILLDLPVFLERVSEEIAGITVLPELEEGVSFLIAAIFFRDLS